MRVSALLSVSGKRLVGPYLASEKAMAEWKRGGGL